MMKEIWKDIKGYEHRYMISNLGRIKSLPKKRETNVFNKAVVTTTTKERIISGSKDKDGYLQTYLSDQYGRMKRYKIHRLVASHFLPKIAGKNYINHKNGIKNDNRVENLEWCTNSENLLHAHHVLRHGKRYYNQKYIIGIEIVTGKKTRYASLAEAAEANHVSKQSISMCLNHHTKSSCGCIWIEDK